MKVRMTDTHYGKPGDRYRRFQQGKEYEIPDEIGRHWIGRGFAEYAIDFASDAAKRLFRTHRLTPDALGEPSGQSGYTKADVRQALED